jgi:hypothetical protein
VETQTFFTFQNKSTNILLRGAQGAYIHSPAGTGGIEGQGQIWWEANKNASDLDPGSVARPRHSIRLDIWLTDACSVPPMIPS